MTRTDYDTLCMAATESEAAIGRWPAAWAMHGRDGRHVCHLLPGHKGQHICVGCGWAWRDAAEVPLDAHEVIVRRIVFGATSRCHLPQEVKHIHETRVMRHDTGDVIWSAVHASTDEHPMRGLNTIREAHTVLEVCHGEAL